MNVNTDDTILQDIKNGKKKPWREKKLKSQVLASSLKRLGYDKRAEYVKDCGSVLKFRRELESGVLRLMRANFCRVSLCPMCQWRKSLKVSCQVSRVMDLAQIRDPDLVPLFLTLTLQNCVFDDLAKTLDILFAGWHEFERGKRVTPLIKGSFRAVEITYDGAKLITAKRYQRAKKFYNHNGLKVGDENPSFDTFHPHIHAIILVEKSYFENESKYKETREWVALWKQAARLSYDPVCDIRVCKAEEGNLRKAVLEVAKYTLKDSQFLKASDKAFTDRLVGLLSEALFKRRLYAYGGIMRELAKELKVDKPGEGDLVHIDDETIRADVATQIERYRWRFGVNNYVRF